MPHYHMVALILKDRLKYSEKAIERLGKNKLQQKIRIDKPNTDPQGNWLNGSNGRGEMTFEDGRSLYSDGTWKHGPNSSDPSTAYLTRKEKEFLKEIGWTLPK